MQVKGTAVLTLPLFIEEKFGKEGLEKWLSNLTGEAKDVYSFRILPTNRYPIKAIMIEPTEKICELFYNNDLKGAWESGRFSANHGLKGIYKVFVKFGSVQFLIKKATTILPTYYDSCTMEVRVFSDKNLSLYIKSFPYPNEIIDHRIGGWVERALEISGCKDIGIEIPRSLAKGDSVTELNMAWK